MCHCLNASYHFKCISIPQVTIESLFIFCCNLIWVQVHAHIRRVDFSTIHLLSSWFVLFSFPLSSLRNYWCLWSTWETLRWFLCSSFPSSSSNFTSPLPSPHPHLPLLSPLPFPSYFPPPPASGPPLLKLFLSIMLDVQFLFQPQYQ